jgi:hypothetical protein
MGNDLPGHELVVQGISDLSAGTVSTASLLVSIGATRLRNAGVLVPAAFPNANHLLYDLLAKEFGDDAHSQYNALIRRLVSYEHALECAK